MAIKTSVLGYPRIGEQRELKKATEAYWKGEISIEDLHQKGQEIRKENWKKLQKQNIDQIPCNDFSFYDQTLDMSCLLGNIPKRFNFNGNTVDLDTLFRVARGVIEQNNSGGTPQVLASDMTKWFNTNYHYIVPEFESATRFKLSSKKVFEEFQEAQALGINAVPVLIGPMTYLTLGKVHDTQNPTFNRFTLLNQLLPVYQEIITQLEALGATTIQIDEPIFSLDLSEEQKAGLKQTYETLQFKNAQLKLTTYFDTIGNNIKLFLSIPADIFHIDTVYGSEDLDAILQDFPENKTLSLGIVNGRNIWKNDYEASLVQIQKALQKIGTERLIISSSCSLTHSPITLKNESALDADIQNWMAFADEKVTEIKELAEIANGTAPASLLDANKAAIASRRNSSKIHKAAVKDRVAQIKAKDFDRQSPFSVRQGLQKEKLKLPLFPTTSIGSFPQTKEVREKRAAYKAGKINEAEYNAFLEAETLKCIQLQEELDIDMLVHGEFERNDMVEYFGENLEGFVFSKNGWVQSYGSRYVKPPIIFGDVSRTQPMTVKWSKFAQDHTTRPMKGMLTGPITILQWSFVRDDQPRKDTTFQIALAIRDEVVDLEAAGIAAIQIDEPAIREGLPLRRNEWNEYLDWAVKAFRLSAAGVKDDTQIHTHMCYSEFNDIIQAIADLDADVISIETSRSKMELLEAFVTFKYPSEIGPGVYDIHSPQIPSVSEMEDLLEKANKVLPTENIWCNPDCGLKTRGYAEVTPALKNMVDAAKRMRTKVQIHA